MNKWSLSILSVLFAQPVPAEINPSHIRCWQSTALLPRLLVKLTLFSRPTWLPPSITSRYASAARRRRVSPFPHEATQQTQWEGRERFDAVSSLLKKHPRKMNDIRENRMFTITSLMFAVWLKGATQSISLQSRTQGGHLRYQELAVVTRSQPQIHFFYALFSPHFMQIHLILDWILIPNQSIWPTWYSYRHIYSCLQPYSTFKNNLQ